MNGELANDQTEDLPSTSYAQDLTDVEFSDTDTLPWPCTYF